MCLTLSSSAQGSWNIGYVPVDSIDKAHVGHSFKIDFKTPDIETKSPAVRTIRSYVGFRDTGYIFMDTTLVKVLERRKIYVDHGSYNEQYLECPNYSKGFTLRIYDAEILEIDNHSILFRLETELNKNGSGKADKSSKVVRIEKAKLDGVMYKL